MSADRWQKCPKCKINEQQRMRQLEEKLDRDYGKVSQEEYQSTLDAIKEPLTLEETLREDFEIGLFKGEFYVRYKGGCQVCGFFYEYNYEDKDPLKMSSD